MAKPLDKIVEDKYVEEVQRILWEAKRQYLLGPPPRGFGIGAIRRGVKSILERIEDPEELDWKTIWESLDRETYSTIESFLADMERSRLIPPAPILEEAPIELDSLLEKLDLEMPSTFDPDFQSKLEDLIMELTERLIEAEKTAGRIKVRVAGKERWWGSRRVTEHVENLLGQIREYKRQAEEEKQRREAAEREARLVRFTVLRDFREGIISYRAGRSYTTEDREWAEQKEQRGLIRIGVEKPPEAPPPEETVEVHMREDVPARTIRGVTYGPYRASSVVHLPKTLADVFIRRELAERYVPTPPRPPPIIWTRDLERRLRDIFEVTLRRGLPEETFLGLSPTRVRESLAEFRLELDTIKTLGTREEMEEAVRSLAREIVRRQAKPPTPRPPVPVPEVRPPRPRIPIALPHRVPEIIEKTCPIGGRKFTMDYNLEKIVRTAQLLDMPAMWYDLCPEHKYFWKYTGYRSIYDALAYRISEGRATAWRKTGRKGLRVLTIQELRDAGLNRDDIRQIEMIIATRYAGEPKEYPKGKLECIAVINDEPVKAMVNVSVHSEGVAFPPQYTPFTLDLERGSYFIQASYNNVLRSAVADIRESKTTVTKLDFSPVKP